MVEREIGPLLRAADEALAAGKPYATVIRFIDEAASLADTQDHALVLAEHRLTAVLVYERPRDQCERALDNYLAVQPDICRRVISTLSAGRSHRQLALARLPALTRELQSAPSSPSVDYALATTQRFLDEQ